MLAFIGADLSALRTDEGQVGRRAGDDRFGGRLGGILGATGMSNGVAAPGAGQLWSLRARAVASWSTANSGPARSTTP